MEMELCQTDTGKLSVFCVSLIDTNSIDITSQWNGFLKDFSNL